jgi:site-specific recombinase XerD
MIEDYLTAKRIGSRHAGVSGSPKTIRAYRAGLKTVERLLGKPLVEITEDDADMLMHTMDEQGFAASYKANILAALRGCFAWAIATGRYQGSHPFAAVSSPKISREIPMILTRNQIDCLLAEIPSEKYRLFFELMYFGGLRIGEVARLQRNDIANDGIIVRGKGGKQRYIYLPESLRIRLKTYTKDYNVGSPYVFYGEAQNATIGKPITLVRAYQEFEQAKTACGLPQKLRPHNLRHTSATHMHAATGDLAMTQKFLGHASPATTVIYAQISDQRMHEAATRVFGE